MPKSWSEYSLADWRRLRPLTHRLKMLRYRLVDAAHMRRRARRGDARALARAIAGRQVLTTIAYADAQTIEWQAQLLRRYVPGPFYLVADNSPDDRSAEAIAAVAARHDVAYVRLPSNPWAAGSRSHGIAINWVWRNIIRPGRPAAFGFLDDDLFPTAPDDPFAALAGQDFYGLVRNHGPRWFLWAGFCMFKFAAVADKALDFGQDWFAGLDTGGANWEVLYRHADRGRLREAKHVQFAFKPGIETTDGPLQWCDTWLHEVGMMGRADLLAQKREAVQTMLAAHLAPAHQPGTSSTER